MDIVNGLLDFIYNFFGVLTNVYNWLISKPFTYDNVGVGWLLLDKLGVNIDWIFNLSPLDIISIGLVTTLSTFLILKLAKMILDAIPII